MQNCTIQDSQSSVGVFIRNERKTFWVVVLTTLTMIVEVVAGYWSGSMALLADGWHMASHAGALGISWLAYRFVKSPKMNAKFTFGAGKIIPLGGYTNSLLLAVVACLMIFESVERLLQPTLVHFQEALWVAVIGLAINLISAWILREEPHAHSHDTHESCHAHDHNHADHDHHSHSHSHEHLQDHNLKSAYMHVLADALTSVLAIVALLAAGLWGWVWLDPAVGILGAVVILRWSYSLCRETGWVLLDGHSQDIDTRGVRQEIQKLGASILDLHVWRVTPQTIACELIVSSPVLRGADFYRTSLLQKFAIQHLVVEEHLQTAKV